MAITAHDEAQEHERSWWGNCLTTYGEETKQIVYARHMGLATVDLGDGQWPRWGVAGSVVDLGGGPCSMLLKATNPTGAQRVVVDPCAYPEWVLARYQAAGISYRWERAEGFDTASWRVGQAFDEAWIYNVLQHVDDPEAVVHVARRAAPVVRIFDWLETAVNAMHPHSLTKDQMDRWVGAAGGVKQLDEGGATGMAYFGVFRTGRP